MVIDCELSAGDIVTVLLSVLLGSFSLGNALPELETFATALGSATVVFEVIDRVTRLRLFVMRSPLFMFDVLPQEPKIDWSAEGGETPDHLEGNIKFSDVVFNYPARPEVQVCRLSCNGLVIQFSTAYSSIDSEWSRLRDKERTNSGTGWTKWVWQEYNYSANSAILQSFGWTGC